MKRFIFFILLSVGCKATVPAGDPNEMPTQRESRKEHSRPLEEEKSHPEDDQFSLYAEQAVQRFNAGEYSSLRSKDIVLLDNWSGLRVSGRLFDSASELFEWVESKDMGVELRLAEGAYEYGPIVRASCKNPGRNLAIGNAEGDRLVAEWHGTPVEYLSEEKRRRALELGSAVTHFLRDNEAGIGLFFGKGESNHWELLVVDLIAPPC